MTAAATPPAPRRASAGAVVAAALSGSFAVGVTVGLQPGGWILDQALLLYQIQLSWVVGPGASLLNAILVAVPTLLLAFIPRTEAVRDAGRAWLGGVAALAVLGSLRAVPLAEPELYFALLAVVALLLAWLFRRRGAARHRPAPGTYAVAGVTGGVVLLPWLWIGALGGVLETLLGLAAAAAVGRYVATLLDGHFWRHFARSQPLLVVVGGLVAGVALLLVAAGVGGHGGQLPLMLTLPPLGFAAAALSPYGSLSVAAAVGPDAPAPGVWRPLWVLFAVAVAGPLAFFDPEETSLWLTELDSLRWTGTAAACGLLLALLLGLLWVPLEPRRGPRWARPVAVAVAVVGAATYLGLGQPGFHGDRLFVIMAEQADLTGLPTGTGQAGRDARAAEVYRRLVTHAERTQAALRADLDRLGLSYRPYYLVNAIEVDAGPAVRAWLAARDDVDRVIRSQRLRPLPAPLRVETGTPGLTPHSPEWNVATIGADLVWSDLGVTGEGIVVGGTDSGVDGEHPALADNYRGGDYSWYDPWNGTTTPSDHMGHGTHTIGTAVGRQGIGVAPGAEWMACVNLHRNMGNPAYYLECLQFMLAPFPPGGDPWRDGRPELAPHVVTNSWVCGPIEGCDAEALRPATQALTAAGIFVVAAAGNAGPFCGSIQGPLAAYPEVFTVGAATRVGDDATEFSSRGPVPGAAKPDLVAPGEQVVSAMPGGGYAEFEGTSMAAPHVAGVVALMWSANPELIGDVVATAEILTATAQPITSYVVECGDVAAVVGAGKVDAHAAVAAAVRRR